MSLNDLQLNDLIIASLYSSSLVIPENDSQAQAKPAENVPQETSRKAENVSQTMSRQIENDSQAINGQAKNKTGKKEAGPARFLGNNNSHILILTNDAQHAFLSEEHLSLLIKMLEACKLNTGDTAIVNLAARPLEYPLLKDQFRPHKILFFGVDPAAIKMPVENTPFNIGGFDGCLYVCAPSLDELNGNSSAAKALKARLWASLQQLFLQKNDLP